MARTRLPQAGDRVIDPTTGRRRTVKWVSRDHIQFNNGTSCHPRNFALFYSEHDVERGNECKPWLSGDERTDLDVRYRPSDPGIGLTRDAVAALGL